MANINPKIGTRLTATFAVVLVFLIAICVVATLQMASLNSTMQTIVGVRSDELKITNQIVTATFRANELAYQALEAQTSQEQVFAVEQAEAVINDNDARYQAITRRINTDAGRAIFSRVTDAHDAYEAAMASAYEQLRGHDSASARLTLLHAGPLRDRLVQQQGEFLDYVQKLMDASGKETGEAYAAARGVLWTCALIAIVVACVLAALVTRSIVRPLHRVVEGAGALARGDLSVRLDIARHDEMGVLADAVDAAIAQLGQIVSGVKQASESISSVTQQFAAGNTELSQRTEEQAASLEQTASSMEQLTATVRQNADSAREASELSRAASDVACRGGEEVERVVQTMQQISDSSARVAEIVSVIEGIAFQTNILALNAAVEAARAGEEGRGFAVVAGEVRSLAQRTATAAREIAVLIGESVTRVKTGSGHVADAGGTIREIVHAVGRVTEMMSEISSASHEQSIGIEQANQAFGATT